MKRWVWFLLLLVAVSMISLHVLPNIPNWLFGLHPEFSDPAKPVRVVAGNSFVITLESNRTTGYGWQFASLVDKDYLEVTEIRHGAKQTKMVGRGTKDSWTFKAVRPGQTVVSFEYVRPWEKDSPPAKTAVFEINVERGDPKS
jgi:inhibitor of cysteine peptidase